MGRSIVHLFLVIVFWLLAAGALVFSSVEIFKLSIAKNPSFMVAGGSRNILAYPSLNNGPTKVSSVISGKDVRPVLVDNFLARYGSPMIGHGEDFVKAADKNGLDWRLLPAIAFQESNLGKKIPRGSYNPFGWAIYEGELSGVYFASWTQAIYAVASKLKEDYINNGLTTPETIVLKYTSRNSSSWTFAVQTAMEELAQQTN